MISFIYDDYISQNTCLVVTLSDGRVAYGDDYRNGKNDKFWPRLKKFCLTSGLFIVKLQLRLRSHWVSPPLADNALGYWFRFGLLCNMGTNQSQGMYKVGYTDGTNLYKFGYSTPELELINEETMVEPVDLNDISLILKNNGPAHEVPQ